MGDLKTYNSSVDLYYNIVIMFCMIQSTQKIIKIGSSAGVTIPAKLLKQEGIKIGDEVEVEITPINQRSHKKNAADKDIDALTRRFIKKYEQALKNLADR
jgi:putative addiction module antidote